MGGRPSVAEAVAAWNKRRYGVDIDPRRCRFRRRAPGADLRDAGVLAAGSKVLLKTPAYNGFYSDLAIADDRRGEPDEVRRPLLEMDFDDFERRISTTPTRSSSATRRTRPATAGAPRTCCASARSACGAASSCSPMRSTATSSARARSTPFASLPNKAIVDNSLTFKAASKSFNVSAHKVAWFYSTNPDLLARVKPLCAPTLTTLGMVANRAAYRRRRVAEPGGRVLEGNHDLVASFIQTRSRRQGHEAGSHYLCWLDVSELMERIGARKLADEYNRRPSADRIQRTPEVMTQRYLVERAKCTSTLVAPTARGRRPHAHEHRDLAQAGGAGARQYHSWHEKPV